jgi:hypothetical protein
MSDTVPFTFTNQLRHLESHLLPPGKGTAWSGSFFEDFFPRALYKLGPGSNFPEWVPKDFFLASAARPFFFQGVYNSGDCMNFDSLVAAVFSPEMMVEGSRLFPALIDRFGFMPGVMNPGFKDDSAFSLDYSGTTWGPCCYGDLFAWSQDREFLSRFADACAKWARWWFENRDPNHDGWIEPGLNGCQPSSKEYREKKAAENPEITRLCLDYWDYVGLQNPNASAYQLAVCEMPWDDWPMYVRGRNRGLHVDPKTCSVNIHFIESQLYISLLCGFTARAYRWLDRKEEAEYFDRQAQRLAGLVRDHCWDEKTGFYYDRDIETGGLRTFAKHLGAFVPMLMGLPTMDQAKRMVAHLTNPDEFWTAWPAPTLSKDSIDYHPTHYWSGRTWPPTNFFVLRALLNYGFFDVADEFLRRWMKQIQFCVERPVRDLKLEQWDGISIDSRRIDVLGVRWIVPENWNPETGEVNGSGGVAWGGLWVPALIMRHFWPLAQNRILLRPGGQFQLQWGDRWKIEITGNRATVNGRILQLPEAATYLFDETTNSCRPLPPGKSDPVCLDGI